MSAGCGLGPHTLTCTIPLGASAGGLIVVRGRQRVRRPAMAGTTFRAALAKARAAVDRALDALNTIERPDSDYVMPLLRAQAELQEAAARYEAVTA